MKQEMKGLRHLNKILILFTVIENESNFNQRLIRAFMTSNHHALRSFQRGCVIAIEILFVQNTAKIPKFYDKIKNSIRLFDNHEIDF